MLTFLREALALARAYRKQGDAEPKGADGPRQFFHEEAALPDGWPPVYGSAEVDDMFVVTVNDIPTRAPRWATEEKARRDAWDRHWADERNAKALATYEAEHSPVMSLDEVISRRSR